jgi:hypothetical protein
MSRQVRRVSRREKHEPARASRSSSSTESAASSTLAAAAAVQLSSSTSWHDHGSRADFPALPATGHQSVRPTRQPVRPRLRGDGRDLHLRNRIRARVAIPSRPRTVIDIGPMDRRREHPLRPVPRLGRSHHQGSPACPTQGDPTYLIAADERGLRGDVCSSSTLVFEMPAAGADLCSTWLSSPL